MWLRCWRRGEHDPKQPHGDGGRLDSDFAGAIRLMQGHSQRENRC